MTDAPERIWVRVDEWGDMHVNPHSWDNAPKHLIEYVRVIPAEEDAGDDYRLSNTPRRVWAERALAAEEKLKCPLDLDATPELCSAGTCPKCLSERALKAEAELAILERENKLQAQEIDKTRSRADKWYGLVIECDEYLKPDETPRQRMDRDQNDVLSLMKLLEREKRRVEKAEAERDRLREALEAAAKDMAVMARAEEDVNNPRDAELLYYAAKRIRAMKREPK